MNRIVSHCGAAAMGAALAAALLGIPQQLEVDLLRADSLRAASREAEHDRQLAAALAVGDQLRAAEWQTALTQSSCSAAKSAAQELLKLAQARREKPVKPAPAAPCPAPAPAKQSGGPAPAAPKKVEPQAVASAAVMVAAHNRWRAEVGVPNLKWSDKLATVAQGYADKLAAGGCKLPMQHSGSRYGENLYWHRASTAVLPSRPVDAWTENEKDWYDPATGQCSAPAGGFCGHYTQVVWKDTKEVGCGMAFCPGSGQVWVCNYSPAGNIVGRKPY